MNNNNNKLVFDLLVFNESHAVCPYVQASNSIKINLKLKVVRMAVLS